MSRLSASEKSLNVTYVDSYISALAIPHAYEDAERLKTLLIQFLEENNITLNNLLPEEAVDLQSRMQKITTLDLKTAENQTAAIKLLTEWKDTPLHHAIAGKGAHVTQHAAQTTGIAANLLKTGTVSLKQWGTDLDIMQCLKNNIVIPRVDKMENGQDYILSPVSLTESPLAIQDKLEKVRDLNQNLQVLIPVNCGNSHWRLVKAKIKDKAISEIELWDSLGGTSDALKNTLAYKNLKAAIDSIAGKDKVNIKTTLTGAQKNTYSCMDYVINEALISSGDLSLAPMPIVPAQLRLAIAKQIATNHLGLGEEVANALVIDGENIRNPNFAPEAKADVEVEDEAEQSILTKIMTEGIRDANQIPFDEMLAQKLAALYKEDNTSDDKTLYKKALKQAIREFGLFAPKPKPTATPDIDSTPTPSPSSKSK